MKRIFNFISINLLCFVALAFAGGIDSSLQPIGSLWQTLFLILTCIAVLLLLRFSRKASAFTAILLMYFILGNLYGSVRGTAPANPSDISYLIQKKSEAILIGRLQSRQGFNGEVSKALMNCRFIQFKGDKDFLSTTGRVLLYLKDYWPAKIMPGDRIIVRAMLSRPHSLQTAGSFDYKTYLENQDIRVTGFVNSPLFIYKFPIRKSYTNIIRYAAQRARVRIGAAIDHTLSPGLAGLYKAILIGDRSGIDNNLIEQFKGSGCMHILSISGMHMSIIGAFLFFVFYWLLRRSTWLILRFDTKKISAIVCLPFLVFYALLAGAKVPVIRSLIMSAVIVLALCAGRRRSIFATLSLAMLLILAWSPVSLFTASFQLTFAAVGSIAAISPSIMKRLYSTNSPKEPQVSLRSRFKEWVVAALLISLSATIGCAPLLLYYFNRLSLIGPAANLVVEPLICFWSLPLGFFACPLVSISPSLAAICFHIGSWGIALTCKLMNYFSLIPCESIWLPSPSPSLIIVYYGSLLLLFFGPRLKKAQMLAWTSFALILFFFCLPPYELFKHFRKNTTITVIDVGQGSANLIEFPAGKRVLIDGGGPSSPRFNTGESVIAPFLWKKGITTIDSVIITHPDSDHFNGLPFIIKHFDPKTLWVNGSTGHNPGYTDLLRLAKRLHVPLRIPGPKTQLLSGGGSILASITNPLMAKQHPSDGGTRRQGVHISSNDSGVIVKFTDQNFSALFPGDISKQVERLLVLQPKSLSADVLLSPHHGSTTSNSTVFLQTVHPAYLIVSSGYRKQGIFPAWNLKEKTKKLGIKMLTTALSGSIVVTTDGIKFSIATGDGIANMKKIAVRLAAKKYSSSRQIFYVQP